ncbi:MAG: hypothetical protein KAT12_06250, partial [Gammaproteobacteria bacterium]|nr:hypothetical protein [Gammaproteobacteria bacterium]
MKKIHQIKAVFAGLLLSSAFVPVATAEDIEIYTSLGAAGTSSNPNILFIVDTSGSMSAETLVKDAYVDKSVYLGNCESTGVYFVDNGKLPDCATNTNWFDRTALVCDHSVAGYLADVYDINGDFVEKGKIITPTPDGALIRIGTYSDQLAQYDTIKNRWRELTIGTNAERAYKVECFSDSGIHGDNPGGGQDVFIADAVEYTSTDPADVEVPHQVWAGGSGNLQLFLGNYLNYLQDNTVPLSPKNRLEQVKSAVEIMVRGNTRVDIGLMRFDSKNNANGGAVQYPILDVGADRNDFFTRLSTLQYGGWTPLSEVYYEALLYFGGKAADFSLLSNPGNQVTADTMMPGGKVFRSPITSTCDKNYIVLLSDGTPTNDELNVTRKSVLPGFNTGSCNTDLTPGTWYDDNRDAFKSGTSTIDNCMDELSEWAFTKDVAEVAGVTAHDGEQHVLTHTIGFQLGSPDAVQLMEDTAKKGGGDFYPANSEAELIEIFNRIVASALQVNTTFSSPAVSVNAFNRSTHLEDLYFTLFKPGDGNHWAGNLKKYKLKFYVDANDDDGDGNTTEKLPFVADQLGNDAVDAATGFFGDTAKSFWTAGAADGKEVSLGGAASVLTASRNVFTYTGSYTGVASGVNVPTTKALYANSNKVEVSNASLTDALIGITGYPEIVAGTPYRETIINWAAGIDALSQFGAANTFNDVRPQMGDPLHSEPSLVQYGGTATNPDLVIYAATNDGYLHAFDADTGLEEFSFIPQELLPNLVTAMENPGGKKLYGLDGSVAAWINDKDDDGIINGTDHVYLYVGMRRGGKNIYALDVTDRTQPELLWVIKGGTGDYTELGQSWSTINVERIKDGADEKTVLMFGGGYDPAQDSATVRTPDSEGRAIFIADATTGERLWSGGKNGDVAVTDMEYSIPARVKPLDISGDGFIDRLYAADMGGQIFRFDIDN